MLFGDCIWFCHISIQNISYSYKVEKTTLMQTEERKRNPVFLTAQRMSFLVSFFQNYAYNCLHNIRFCYCLVWLTKSKILMNFIVSILKGRLTIYHKGKRFKCNMLSDIERSHEYRFISFMDLSYICSVHLFLFSLIYLKPIHFI